MKQLVIIGASGHGKVVADIAVKTGYDSVVFLDDNSNLKTCGRFPVVGTSEMLKEFTCDVIVAIGNTEVRQRILEKVLQQHKVPILVHPQAVIADDVELGTGTVIMAGAVVNSGAVIGKGVIINTSSSVDHDCTLGDYVHVAIGAHLAGTVIVGNRTWIGAGAIVSNNIAICEECTIGAGATVVKNINEKGVYVGTPARKMKRLR